MTSEWLKTFDSLSQWNKSALESFSKVGKVSSVADLETKIETSTSEVVHSVGRVKLLRYTPIREKVVPAPLLVAFALINKYYILDLQPDRSVIRRYLEHGLDVYVIDWGSPRPWERYETMGDIVSYIDEMVDYMRKEAGLEKVNLHGYCMGGTFSVMYAALYPQKLRNLVVQAAPIDFSTNSGILNVWSRYVDVDKLVDTFGNVPSEFLNISFLLVNPVRLLFDKYVSFYENIKDKDFVENFLRMEKWIFDSPDLPGETYRQFLKELYKENLLVKNELVVDGRKVSLKRINMPLLSLVADQDNLVPPESSLALNDLVSSKDKKTMRYPGGHIGLSVSQKTHKEFWPEVAEWIIRHSTRKKGPRP